MSKLIKDQMIKQSLLAIIDIYVDASEESYNINRFDLLDILNDLISSREELIDFILYYFEATKKYYFRYSRKTFDYFNRTVICRLKLYDEVVQEKLKLIELLE